MLGAAGLALVPLPYVVMRPGPAVNALGDDGNGRPLISVSGAATYPTSGTLDFTTVSVAGGPGYPVNVWDVLYGWASPRGEVFKEADIFPDDVTTAEVKQQNAAEMTHSQEEAITIALRSLGKKVGERYLISEVADDSPAKKTLEPEDQILSIDGEDITNVADIQRLVRARPAGSTLGMDVKRDGKIQTLSVKSMSSEGTAILGIRLRIAFEYPFDVQIDAQGMGGPSAGTMFALAVRDLLTPGEMTGGKKIAGTGTIDEAGNVGPIGGIRQKVFGARDAGAEFFLTPAANCADLSGKVPQGLQVVKVATYDEAVHAVEAIAAGTGSLPRC